ncbi:hypothetical protein DY000_02000516 [Brassica cretica]|uniref:C2 domain-containing protein n=1 Tax=Brassica cretica TaxID=69181 RepID=A0ABQ7C5H6_BRACR|nr:hypothetical protein DY000_02000516 [Brassica cretica]
MEKPGQNIDFALKETSPKIGAGAVTGDKLSCTYDLVEQMHYLYVRVVKAKELPGKDLTGSCDPYVEVKLGNYRGMTKHFEKKSNPEWRQVFAFSKERIQASILEVIVKDKNVMLDDFIGGIMFDLNEIPKRYTWEVFDTCTVITFGAFDNGHIPGGSGKDTRIGKVRIRLSTLESDRIYTHSYPLLVFHPSGIKKTGEIQLAVRFTCLSVINMLHMYSQPLLPKMHYIHPLSVLQLDSLRYQAMNIVSARLNRAEPPLRKEVVEYMLDVDSHMWSMRRSKANFFRIMNVLSGLVAVTKWFDQICHWRNPITTVLIHVLFIILVLYPELILPTVFLYLFLIGIWNFRWRPRHPPHMDTRLSHADAVHPDELDEEFDTFPTSRSPAIVRMRYDRLRSIGGRVQTVIGDLATQGERFLSLLSWRDPRATTLFLFFCLIAAVVLYVTPFQVVALLTGIYLLRHPRFRHKLPSVPLNLFRRLPARSDSLI